MEKNMSFNDLDSLIDSWAAELQEYQYTFQNQSQGLTAEYWTMVNNNNKINKINSKMNILHSMNSQIKTDIKNAKVFIQKMEKKIEHLEENFKPLYTTAPTYTHREQLYGVFGNINIYLHNNNEKVDIASRDSNEIALQLCTNPQIEVIAKIMMKLLEALENVEVSIEKMKSYIHHINWKNKVLEEKCNVMYS